MRTLLPFAIRGCAPLTQPFRGTHQVLPFTRIDYELVSATGELTDNIVVALGGISATRHITANQLDPSEGWWQPQVGPGCALDTDDLTVIGIDYLGATLESDEKVPLVDTRDQARAIAAVLDDLEIAYPVTIVGASYGGMVALAFGELFPDRVAKLVVIGAAHRPHPMATALRLVQRKIVLQASAHGKTHEGLKLARQLAMTTYRTAAEFATRFTSPPEVDAYLEHCGRRYVETFTAERFLCLSQSIDLHRVDPHDIGVPTTLVSIEGDAIAPPAQVRELAAALGARARLIEIDSIYGHDAFLKEVDAISHILAQEIQVEVQA